MAEGLETPRPSGGAPIRRSPGFKGQTSYAHRFRAAYVLLALLFWGAVGTGTIVMARGGRADSPPWSMWTPTESGFKAAQQIAKHVSSEYLLGDVGSDPLVFVHPHEVDATQLAGFFWRSGSEELPSKRTLIYEFCGAAATPSCAIEGPASDARTELIRREALELILYSYKYVEGYDSVVTFLPPSPKTPKQLRVVLFRHEELKNELRRPLRLTLSTPRRVTPSSIATIDETAVKQLTAPHFFNAKPVGLPSGSSYLELSPVR